jgi:4-amino-4-deoxy-L-arabinose transferase-like glycosyltransferase
MAAILFIPFLGQVHLFDWDEINFAECAREMIVTGDYFSVKINFQPFWEKPPVFIWMQVLSMKIFGVNEFAARFPNAVCGILSLLVLFNIGKKIYDEKFGMLWAFVYASSFLPHFYFKSGIIDPWFNLFIFTSIYYFVLFTNNPFQIKNLIWSALLIGVAILTKGPVAFLIVGLCGLVYLLINRFKLFISVKHILVYVFIVCSVGGFWFLLLVLSGNTYIIKEFFVYQIRLLNTQDAGHGGPFVYHWIVLLVGCFPISVFALKGFRTISYNTPFQRYFKTWMLILFWVVLILFSIVKTKIVHYSSLCYFPLSFIGTYYLYKLLLNEIKWKNWMGYLLIFLSFIIGTAISILPLVDKYKQKIIDANIIKDDFAVENLKASVSWNGIEWMFGLLLLIGTIAGVFLIKRGKIKNGIVFIFASALLTINLASLVVVPKIEPYSQGAAIEFYQSLKNKDCYVETIGFKSYAHLFYSDKKYQQNSNSYSVDWLLNGEIDKDVYIVSKINTAEEIKNSHPQLEELYRKNGFVFYIRKAK